MTAMGDNEKISIDLTSPDESSRHLTETNSKNFNGPTATNVQQTISVVTSSTKPMLIRQDRTYLTSPQLSATGGNFGESEESTDDFRIDEAVKSAPDIYHVNYELGNQTAPKISISPDANAHSVENAQLIPALSTVRCRTCRRSSTSPTSIIYLDRSTSKDSIVHGYLRPHLLVHHHSTTIPPSVLISHGSPTRSSRVIRQSSQPESSSLICSGHCTHTHQSSSLRQLRDPSDGISGIASEALRVS